MSSNRSMKGCSVIILMVVFGELCAGNKLNIQIDAPVHLKFDDRVTGNTNNLFGTSIALSGQAVFIGAPKYSYGGGVFHCDVKGRQCNSIEGFPGHDITKRNEWVKNFSNNSTGYTWKNEVNDCTWRVLETYVEKKIRDTSCAYEGGCRTTSGKSCKFPFSHEQRTHHNCINLINKPNNKRFCQTAAVAAGSINFGKNEQQCDRQCESRLQKCTAFCKQGAEPRLSARGALLGASIMVTEDNKVVACAPKESSIYSFIWKKGMGTCYNFGVNENPARPLPMFNFGGTVEYFQANEFDSLEEKHGAGIVGHSMTWGKSNSIVVGSPNFNLGDPSGTCKSKKGSSIDCRFSGVGNILKYGNLPGKPQKAFLNPSKDSKKNYFRLDLKRELNDKNQGTPSLYLGATVIRGKFSRPSYDDGIDYAFAAPSGESLFGATYICPDCFKDSSVEGVFANTIELSGYQIGERFGHSLCAVDINGDNYDDLVVGAPLHSEGKSFPNTGTVYVFENMNGEFRLTAVAQKTKSDQVKAALASNPRQNPATLGRKRPISANSRYGTALINLRELQGNGFEAFAVGAPYEDEGTGAVYIYYGSANFWRGDSLSDGIKVTPENWQLPIVGFGYSFSNVGDGDKKNGKPYFAVGAINTQRSDTKEASVILFNSEPLRINVCKGCVSTAIVTPTVLGKSDKEFTVVITLPPLRMITTASPGEMSRITVKVDFDAIDERISLSSGSRSEDYRLDQLKNTIKKRYTFKLRDIGRAKDILTKIPINVKITWSCQGAICTNSKNVVEDSFDLDVNFAKGCDDVKACRCDVSFHYLSSDIKNDDLRMTVDSDRDMDLKAAIKNDGTEPAYGIILEIKSTVLWTNIPSSCANRGKEKGIFSYECEVVHVGNSTEEELPISFGILEMLRQYGALKENPHYLRTRLRQEPGLACSSASQTQPLPFTKIIDLYFEFNYKIEITPKLDDEVHAISENIVEFQHLFEISNEGTSPTNKDISFYLDVPEVVLPGDPAFTDEHRAQCNLQETTPNKTTHGIKLNQVSCDVFGCKRYNCTLKQGLDKNKQNNPVGVILRMKANPKLLNASGLLTEQFDILTKVTMDNKEKISKSTFQKNKVGSLEALKQWWPIVVGVVIAAILCGLCIWGFVKSGLLQRLRFYDNPEENER